MASVLRPLGARSHRWPLNRGEGEDVRLEEGKEPRREGAPLRKGEACPRRWRRCTLTHAHSNNAARRGAQAG